jgi:hypothetical protein
MVRMVNGKNGRGQECPDLFGTYTTSFSMGTGVKEGEKLTTHVHLIQKL